jgi:hypothetical protein
MLLLVPRQCFKVYTESKRGLSCPGAAAKTEGAGLTVNKQEYAFRLGLYDRGKTNLSVLET